MGRREEILDVLGKKFQEEGFSMDLTLAQIAERMGMGKSTIYEYFKSKDEIYKEAILRIIQSHIDDTIHSMDSEGDFKTSFIYALDKLLEIAAHSRMMLEVFTRNFVDKLPDGLREDLRYTMEDTRDVIEGKFGEIFQKGVMEGVVVFKDDPLKQEIVSSLVVGSIVRYTERSQHINRQLFIEEIYKTVVQIING